MEAGRDIHLTGATLEALGDKGSMILKAGKDLILDTDSLQAKKDMTENRIIISVPIVRRKPLIHWL